MSVTEEILQDHQDNQHSSAPSFVSVLTIEYRHGNETFVCEDKEVAEDVLLGYVNEWWPIELGEDTEMPEDATEAIKAYFDKVEGEIYSIVSCPIIRRG